MLFILSKILSFLTMPLTWIALLLLASFFWKKNAQKLRLASIILIFFFGNSFILHEINLIWEPSVVADQDVKKHKVCVVLGGYAYYSPENDRITFRQSTDRLMQGLRLYKQGKVDHIILSGGSGYVTAPEMKESIHVAAFLSDMGIPSKDITIESESRNTHENSVNTASILKNRGLDKQEIILVTSAYHSPRAKACFEKQGIQVLAFPSDPTTGERMFTPDHLFMPQAEVFSHWNILLHEWMGFAIYKLTGYA